MRGRRTPAQDPSTDLAQRGRAVDAAALLRKVLLEGGQGAVLLALELRALLGC